MLSSCTDGEVTKLIQQLLPNISEELVLPMLQVALLVYYLLHIFSVCISLVPTFHEPAVANTTANAFTRPHISPQLP